MTRRKHIDPQALRNLKEVIVDSGLSYARFAESLTRPNYETSSQNVQRYLKGENEMPVSFANEVARVYGINAAWLLGLSPYKTPVEESANRLAELQTREKKKLLFFELMASMRGWRIERLPEVAAPYTGAGDSFDMTESGKIAFNHFITLERKEEKCEIDRLSFDRLVNKMLDAFDFELSHRW